MKKYKLGFNSLILFNYNYNKENTQKRFIQKATVCVYRFIQTV